MSAPEQASDRADRLQRAIQAKRAGSPMPCGANHTRMKVSARNGAVKRM